MMTLAEKRYMERIHKSPLSRTVYFVSKEEAEKITRLACKRVRELEKQTRSYCQVYQENEEERSDDAEKGVKT